MRTLTGDADVGLAALGGPRRAPGHTLAPEVLRPEELFHLLPRNLDAGFSPPGLGCGGGIEEDTKGKSSFKLLFHFTGQTVHFQATLLFACLTSL